jgi:hypothetical protein
VTETFTSTLVPGLTVTHAFTTSSGGAVNITITSIAPVSTIQVGLGVGVWDGTTCAIALSTNQARQGETYQAVASLAGSYCIAISDVGNVVGESTYSVDVVHP